MSSTGTNTADSQEVTFHDAHHPFLEEGTYTAIFSQNISGNQVLSEKKDQQGKVIPNEQKAFKLDLDPKEINFNIAGPRFQFPPSIVHAVHPPAGGQGNYMSHLPKITLKRSTLPWERSPEGSGVTNSNSASWLFLLLVDEAETTHIKELNGVQFHVKSASEHGKQPPLKDSTGNILKLDDLGGEVKLHKQPFNALNVDQTWARNLIPTTLDELQYLSFASIKKGEHEHGVILSNRLPVPGNNSTVYLISLENNYVAGSFKGKKLEEKYFFPYFYKWSFHTNVDYLVTEAISADLAKQFPEVESLTPIIDQLFTSWEAFEKNPVAGNLSKDATAWVKQKAKLPGVTFHGLLHNLTAGFKAFNVDGGSGLSSIGTIKMPFKPFKEDTFDQETEGDGSSSEGLTTKVTTKKESKDVDASCEDSSNNKTTSKDSSDEDTSKTAYYHGPFVAAKVKLPSQLGLPMKDAGDWNMQLKATDLYLFNSKTSQTDYSYGAALELGRLTALNNVAFAESFIAWKKQAAAALYQTDATVSHLSFYPNAQYSAVIPGPIRQQFEDWQQLKGIPYQYLIPDPTLLPLESLRYFYLDTHWINAFLYGAFSIGHTIRPNSLKHLLNDLLMENSTKYQGFLLNSFAVSGWPDFEVNASQNSAPIKGLFIPRKNLNKNMVLQVYDQNFDQLEFQLHHSKNHSGFLFDEVEINGVKENRFLKHKVVEKEVKVGQETHLEDELIEPPIIVDIQSNNRINNVKALANKIDANNVSQFAKMILEGTPKVIFKIE